MKKLMSVAAVTAALVSPVTMAQDSVAMFSTLDGYNAPSNDAVGGVRLSVLHGKVSAVKGVDVSVLGMSETDTTTGLNLGMFFGASKVNKEMKGLSLGLFNWNTGSTKGANFGIVNLTNDVKGVNVSAVNYSEGFTMADVGLVSLSEKSNIQLGVFNKTKQIEGVQIGLINCADNGFLPCFPLVNFAI
ncbi:VC2662 family protein [Vibrio nigripulchritudo]|uniref:VC2662 family protein n=1 Tax=Vibrio nigripulchritudo TaxID=28173 RepID=UPI0003B18D45|nr:hypothetical protein [Vibrio nigripulchritudo]CCN69180.1 conserved hypothetical protein [Vibrio nigripulchritudo SFn118]